MLSDCNHGWVGLLAGFPFLRLAKKTGTRSRLCSATGSWSHFGLALFWSAFVFLSVIVMCLAKQLVLVSTFQFKLYIEDEDAHICELIGSEVLIIPRN